jgi:hypothetical protein
MAGLPKEDRHEGVAPAELEAQEVVDLPPREAMSVIATDVLASGDNVAVPTNEAVAVNYDSNYSVAIADSDQVVRIEQTAAEDEPGIEDDRPGRGWGRRGRR